MTMFRRGLLPWGATALLLILCLMPKSTIPRGEDSASWKIPHLDKFVHFGMFAGFSFAWIIAGRTPSPSRSRVIGVLAAAFALAVCTELLQGLPQIQRDPDVMDALADCVGAVVSVGGVIAVAAARQTAEVSGG